MSHTPTPPRPRPNIWVALATFVAFTAGYYLLDYYAPTIARIYLAMVFLYAAISLAADYEEIKP